MSASIILLWGGYGAIVGHLVAWGELHYIEIVGMGYDIDGLGRQYRGLREF